MSGKASLTALMSAYARAYHAGNAHRPVFDDTMAARLMTEAEYLAVGGYITSGMSFLAPERAGSFASDADALRYLVNLQMAPTPVARARFTEDALKCALRSGTCQYVILGAGLDSFALREAEIARRIDIFEIDHPLTQADKLERIRRAGLALSERLHFVPVDLTNDDLSSALTAAGFDRRKKAFFAWPGVSYYLSRDEISAMLTRLAALAPEGSALVFDYGDEGLFTSETPRVRNMLAMASAGGEPMKSCFSYAELEALLERHGFLIYEHLTPDDIERAYFTEGDTGLHAFEHTCYVNAVLKKI